MPIEERIRHHGLQSESELTQKTAGAHRAPDGGRLCPLRRRKGERLNWQICTRAITK
jgi:hypothetical protein